MSESRLWKIMLSFATAIWVTGCSLSSQNVTPSEFPYVVPADLPDSIDLYFGSTTWNELLGLAITPGRRFLLETKRKNVTDVSAYVNVNGVEFPMTQQSGSRGNGLWTYETPDVCQPNYSYYFRLRYKAGLYGWEGYTRGSSSNPFVVQVTHNGSFVWYTTAGSPMTGNGTISMNAQDRERRLYLQNLATSRVRVDFIGFSASDPDLSDFEQFDRPTLPVILDCGETMDLGIRYVGSGDINDALDMLIRTSYEAGAGNWIQNPTGILITLTGGPGPG